MSEDKTAGGAPPDPLEFLKSMWGGMGFTVPGMVTPTLDLDELDKRIAELKAVEGWLRMNLNMLQMNIQGLELQRATLGAMQAMGQAAGSTPETAGLFANMAAWPWAPFTPQAAPPDKAAEGPAPESRADQAAGPAAGGGTSDEPAPRATGAKTRQ